MFLGEQLVVISEQGRLQSQQLPIWIPIATQALRKLGVNILNAAVQVVKVTIQTSIDIDANLKQIAMDNQVPVIVWGVNLPLTTAHTVAAITGSGFTKDSVKDWDKTGPQSTLYKATPLPVVLSRAEPEDPRADWYYDKEPCKSYSYPRLDKYTNSVCDEYPFATTAQGGKSNYDKGLVSLFPVPNYEQSGRGQGNLLKSFFGKTKGDVAVGGRDSEAYMNPKSIFISFFTPAFVTYYINRQGVAGYFDF
jgi:hypothetical protein